MKVYDVRDSRSDDTSMRWLYKWRGVLAAPPIVFATLWPREASSDVTTGWGVGLALFVSGWALRIWARRHSGYRLGGQRALATCGPYAYVRNPAYLGIILMVAGAVAAAGELRLVPLALVWCAVTYTLAIRYEESRLTREYPAAYGAYRTTIGRWIPSRPSGRANERCPHRALVRPLLAELHTPLIMAPAIVKPGLLTALAFLSSTR